MQPPADPISILQAGVKLDSPIRIVDIGANPVNGAAPYKKLLDAGVCHVYGFEPHPEAHEKLLATCGPRETYIRGAVGNGDTGRLHIYGSSGFTSLYPLRTNIAGLIKLRPNSPRLIETVELRTTRLDDIDEIEGIDFLKIDIQGGELEVFRHGRGKLRTALALQTEMRFLRLYEGEPSFGEVDAELLAQGFEIHNIVSLNRFRVAGAAPYELKRRHSSQLIDGDIVYVRALMALEARQSDALRKLAYLAAGCFGSHDLALTCLAILAQRGEVDKEVAQSYVLHLPDRV